VQTSASLRAPEPPRDVRERLRLRRVLRPEGDGQLRLQTDGRQLRDLLALLDEPAVAALPITGFVADKTLNAKTVGELAASPHLARFRSIRLIDVKLGDDGFATLLGSPHTTSLEELSLFRTGIGAGGLAALARSPIALRDLSLDEGKLPEEAVAAYLRSPAAASLRSLATRRKISPALFRAIAESPHLASLETLEVDEAGLATTALAPLASASFAGLSTLSLGSSPITSAVFALLDKAPFATALRKLALFGTRVDDGGLAKLAAASRLALTSLDVHRSDVRGPGVGALAGAAQLAGLTHISLGGSRSVHDRGDQAAEALGAWKSLRDVTLDYCALTDAGAEALARLGELRALRIAGSYLTPKGASALGGAAFARHLEELDLERYASDPKIGPLGATGLARGDFAALRVLNLKDQSIGNAGAEAIAKAFPRLEKLDLSDCGLGPAAIDALAGARFRQSLEDLDLAFNKVGTRVARLGKALPRLRVLDLTDTKVGTAALVELLANAPDTLEDIDVSECGDLGNAAVDALIARAGQLTSVSGAMPRASKEKKAALVAALKPLPASKAKVKAEPKTKAKPAAKAKAKPAAKATKKTRR
jgi:hypothetical protein